LQEIAFFCNKDFYIAKNGNILQYKFFVYISRANVNKTGVKVYIELSTEKRVLNTLEVRYNIVEQTIHVATKNQKKNRAIFKVGRW